MRHDSMNTKGKQAILVKKFRNYRLLASKVTKMNGTDCTVLQLWSTHAHGLSLLSSLAHWFLATSETLVFAKIAFSMSSFTRRKKEFRLLSDNLRGCTILTQQNSEFCKVVSI